MLVTKRSIIFLLATLAALVDSIYLTYHHYWINILTPTTKSFCSISSFIDCDSVALSDFSMLWGMPVSSLGVFAYLFVLLFFIFAIKFKSKEFQSYLSFLYAVLLIMLLFSLRELYFSLFEIEALCIMCSLLYVLILVMIVTLKTIMGISHKDIFITCFKFIFSFVNITSKKIDTVLLIAMLILSAGGAMATDLIFKEYFIKQKKNLDAQKQEASKNVLLDKFFALPKVKLNLADTPSEGAESASIDIVEYSDFQCPACEKKSEELRKLMMLFPGQIKLYFKNFPLDHNCNPLVKREYHPFACQAAVFAYCAWKQRKFWNIHDQLFKNRRIIDEALIETLIAKEKMDTGAAKNCMRSTGRMRVATDVAEGIQLKLNYTPSIFINGRKVSDIIKNRFDMTNLITLLLDKGKQ